MEQEQNYKLLFPRSPSAITDVLGQLPESCRYPLLLAQIARQYDFEQATLLRQQCKVDSFYIELVQLCTQRVFSLQYELGQPRLFLFFMLEGKTEFSIQEDQHVTHARKDTFYLSYNQEGLYQASCSSEQSLALVIAIDTDWALKSTETHPHLHSLLQILIHSKQSFGYTPHCPIDRKVNLWLSQLYKLFNRNIAVVDAMLRVKVLEALDYYEDLLISTGILTLYKVKDRIEQEFTKPLTVDQLAEQAHMHLSTLNRRFKKEFGMSPYSYVISLRMELAYKLIHEQGVDYADVWLQVGYEDPSTFHKAYTKRFLT